MNKNLPYVFVYLGLVKQIADRIEKRRKDWGHIETPEESFRKGFGHQYRNDEMRRRIYRWEVNDELIERKLKEPKRKVDASELMIPNWREKVRIVRRAGWPPRPKIKQDPNHSFDFGGSGGPKGAA